MKGMLRKLLDVVAYGLLIIGALNWGLVGLFNVNVVSHVFGPMTLVTRVIYSLIGVAAVYDLFSLPSIVRRWDVHVRHHPVKA
ncbi:MAG: DUF378 domain-containing protein [Sedimentisphaerales bacterium]|jgi:uncharacterized membrane protein YuzA (DUF378 family)